jgi:hypothetical protein
MTNQSVAEETGLQIINRYVEAHTSHQRKNPQGRSPHRGSFTRRAFSSGYLSTDVPISDSVERAWVTRLWSGYRPLRA